MRDAGRNMQFEASGTSTVLGRVVFKTDSHHTGWPSKTCLKTIFISLKIIATGLIV